MRRKREYADYLRDILEHAAKAQQFVAGIGMRAKLVHDYFGVDLEVVWKTVHQDLPPLRAAVARMPQELEQEGAEV